MPNLPFAVDGDTLYLPDGRILRLNDNVDAPEMAHPENGTRAEPGAALALQFAQQYQTLPGVETQTAGALDPYGRVLGTRQAPGHLSLGQAQIARGLAAPGLEGTASDPGVVLNRLKSLGLAPMEPGEAEQRAEILRQGQGMGPNPYLQRPMGDQDLFGRAMGRGVDSMQQALGGAAAWLGDATGIDAIRDFGVDVVAENQAQIALNPAQYSGLAGLKKNPLGYLTELAGEQVPNIASTIASGGVGAAAARLAAERVAARAATTAMADQMKRGAIAGVAASTFPQHLGEAENAMREAGAEGGTFGALGTAAFNTALDMSSLVAGAAPVAKAIGMGQAQAAKAMREVPKHVLQAVVTEGGTEGLQEFTKQLLVHSHTGRPIDYDQLRDAALAGGIMGGTLSAAGDTAAVGYNKLTADPAADPAPAPAPTQTLPEAPSTVQAQLDAVADPANPKDFAFLTDETAATADAGGVQLPEGLGTAAAADGAESGVVVAPTQEAADAVAAEVAQTGDLQSTVGEALGYTKTKEAIDPADNVAVRALDANGVPVQEEVADAESLDAAMATASAIAAPAGGTADVVPTADALAARQAQVDAEAPAVEAAAAADPKQALAELDARILETAKALPETPSVEQLVALQQMSVQRTALEAQMREAPAAAPKPKLATKALRAKTIAGARAAARGETADVRAANEEVAAAAREAAKAEDPGAVAAAKTRREAAANAIAAAPQADGDFQPLSRGVAKSTKAYAGALLKVAEVRARLRGAGEGADRADLEAAVGEVRQYAAAMREWEEALRAELLEAAADRDGDTRAAVVGPRQEAALEAAARLAAWADEQLAAMPPAAGKHTAKAVRDTYQRLRKLAGQVRKAAEDTTARDEDGRPVRFAGQGPDAEQAPETRDETAQRTGLNDRREEARGRRTEATKARAGAKRAREAYREAVADADELRERVRELDADIGELRAQAELSSLAGPSPGASALNQKIDELRALRAKLVDEGKGRVDEARAAGKARDAYELHTLDAAPVAAREDAAAPGDAREAALDAARAAVRTLRAMDPAAPEYAQLRDKTAAMLRERLDAAQSEQKDAAARLNAREAAAANLDTRQAATQEAARARTEADLEVDVLDEELAALADQIKAATGDEKVQLQAGRDGLREERRGAVARRDALTPVTYDAIGAERERTRVRQAVQDAAKAEAKARARADGLQKVLNELEPPAVAAPSLDGLRAQRAAMDAPGSTATRAEKAALTRQITLAAKQAPLLRAADVRTAAAGLAVAQVERLARAFMQRWGVASAMPEIRVVPTTQDLPQAVLGTAKERRAGKVKGAYHKGTVFIVADTHATATEVFMTTAHEWLGHHGLARYLDERAAALGQDYKRAVMELYNVLGQVEGMRRLLPAKKRAVFDEDIATAGGMESAADKALFLTNEFVALAQEVRGDESLPRQVYRKVMEFVGFIRQKVLKRLGWTWLDKMTTPDLFRFLAAIEGKAIGLDTAGSYSNGPMLSRQRDPADSMIDDPEFDNSSVDPRTGVVMPNPQPAPHTPGQQGQLRHLAQAIAKGGGTAVDGALALVAPLRSSIAQLQRFHKGFAQKMSVATRATREDRRMLMGKWAEVLTVAEREDGATGLVAKTKRALNGSEALTRAYDELIEGRVTSPTAVAMRAFLDEAGRYINTREYGHVALRQDYLPQAHNMDRIRQDPDGFAEFLMRGNGGEPFVFRGDGGADVKFTLESAEAFVQSLLDPHLTDRATLELRSPAVPYAGSLKQRTLVDREFQRRARDAGWLYPDPNLVMQYYIDSITKEVAWSNALGGMLVPESPTGQAADRGVDVQAVVTRWLPTMGFPATQQGLNEAARLKWVQELPHAPGRYAVYVRDLEVQRARQVVNNTHGRQAARRLDKIIDGLMGNLGADMDPRWKQTQQWVLLLQSTTTLLFSTLASIPELGIAVAKSVNEAGLAATLRGVRNLATRSGRAEAVGLARALGIAGQELSNVPLLDSSMYQDMQGLPRKLMDAYFKINLNHYWTESMRVLTASLAVEAFRTHLAKAEAGDADSIAFFQSLGTTPSSVKDYLDAGMPNPAVSNKAFGAESAARAIYRFVDSKVVMPSAEDMPVWMNDPRFALIAQLKRFFYAYGRVVALPLLADARRRYDKAVASNNPKAVAMAKASVPLITVAAFAVPLAALTQQLREDLRGDEDEEQWAVDNIASLISSTGVLGPVDLAMSFAVAEANGQDGFTRALGPAAGHLSVLLQHGPFSAEFLKRSTPIFGQLPQAREFWDELRYAQDDDGV